MKSKRTSYPSRLSAKDFRCGAFHSQERIVQNVLSHLCGFSCSEKKGFCLKRREANRLYERSLPHPVFPAIKATWFLLTKSTISSLCLNDGSLWRNSNIFLYSAVPVDKSNSSLSRKSVKWCERMGSSVAFRRSTKLDCLYREKSVLAFESILMFAWTLRMFSFICSTSFGGKEMFGPESYNKKFRKNRWETVRTVYHVRTSACSSTFLFLLPFALFSVPHSNRTSPETRRTTTSVFCAIWMSRRISVS